MQEARRESIADRLLASACATALCGAFLWAHGYGAFFWNGSYARPQLTPGLLAVMAAVMASLPWMSARRRPQLALLGSLLVGALITGYLLIVPLLFCALALRVSRASWSVWQKLLVLLGVWLAVTVLMWVAPRAPGLYYGGLSLYWACLPPAVIWLVVERARGLLNDVQPCDEWAYFLAMPRFVLPFLQPIGAARFMRSQRELLTPRYSLGALGLGLYAILCFWIIVFTHYSVKSPTDELSLVHHGPRIARNLARIYAFNAGQIFCAVAILRMLGYDLGSGFRYPLLASSFSDIYRRWNYYFFEYATSIFYFPLITWLRARLPLWLAYVIAGYVSILCGVWLVDNVFAQLPMGRFGVQMLEQVTNWQELTGDLLAWSLIIWPQVLLGPFRRLRRHWWWRAAAHALTLAVAVAVLVTLFVYRITVY